VIIHCQILGRREIVSRYINIKGTGLKICCGYKVGRRYFFKLAITTYVGYRGRFGQDGHRKTLKNTEERSYHFKVIAEKFN
jgi:hypothetical protein